MIASASTNHHSIAYAATALILSLVFLIAGCAQEGSGVSVTDAMKLTALSEIAEQKLPDYSGWEMEETDDGVRYVVLTQGTGENVWYDDEVRVHYYLWLTDDSLHDSSRPDGVSSPLEFTVGEGRVIRGWEEIIREMNLGSEVLAVIPWKLGYGREGARGIPRKADLVFYIKLLRIR